MSRRTRTLIIRVVALAGCVVLLLPLLPWPGAALVVPALSPFVAIGGAIAAQAVPLRALLALPVLVMSLLRGRWFCRTLCPVGLLTEQVDRLSLGKGSWTARVPRLGRWLVLLTLGGACLGYPLFLWLDPLAIFSGAFGAPRTLLAVVPMAAVLALGFVLPGAWCACLCPLGATQELLGGCKRTFGQPSAGWQPAACSYRRRAWLRLASEALLVAAGAGIAFLMRRAALARGSPPIRPPGALDEGRFAGVCTRCGNCIRACPTGILRHDAAPARPEGWLAPIAVFDRGYCREDCAACSAVCPSGAIACLSPKEKRLVAMGIAKVELEFCHLANDHECEICRRHCPFGAITYAWDESAYSRRPLVDASRCTGCGACEVACPCTSGPEQPPQRKAIRVAPRRATLPEGRV